MIDHTATGTLLRLLAWGILVSPVACDFGGDRSLGTVSPAASSTAGSGTTALPQAGGAAATIFQPPLALPNACHLTAQQPECGEGQFCAIGPSCGRDQDPIVGNYQQPVDCGDTMEPRVVCGCDGQFHESRCLAERTGISTTDLSVCEPRPCLSAGECDEFSSGCIDTFGGIVTGALCSDGYCACGGTVMIL